MAVAPCNVTVFFINYKVVYNLRAYIFECYST